MRYELFDDNGNVINRIVADIDFVQKNYPNKFREIGELLSDVPSVEELASLARKNRNILLATTDWTQLPDAPVNKQAWATYRQALRDVPQQAGFPTEINWPEEPK